MAIALLLSSCSKSEKVNSIQIGPSSEREWARFMAEQDLVFTHPLKPLWGESLFIADGLTGASIYPLENDKNSLRWELGRTDVSMESTIPGIHPIPERLPIGDIVLKVNETLVSSWMRLNLWNAQVEFELVTSTGKISGSSFVERGDNVVVIELTNPDGVSFTLEFEEKWSVTPKVKAKVNEIKGQYLPPKPHREIVEGADVVIQERVRRGAHAVANLKEEEGATTHYFLTIGKHYSDDATTNESARFAKKEAVSKVVRASRVGVEGLTIRHRDRWHRYFRQAWVGLPDSDEWEKFYWIQIYKFGSASHPNIPIVPDTMGPWYHATEWGATWWNLNTQLTYFPTFSANRLDAGKSLITAINHFYESKAFAYRGNPEIITMGRNAPYRFNNEWGTWELGNLTWVLHNYWRYWKYSMDPKIAEDLFPILKANMNYYFEVMYQDDNGMIHLPKMLSPEYNIPTMDKRAEDTNYSLQSFQWGLQTLLQLDSILETNDPQRIRWGTALENLIDLPLSDKGFDIALGHSYAESHRHYSHLLTFYPYQTHHPDDNSQLHDLLKTSVDHWISKKEHLSAYSYTGAAAMYAILRDGDKALNMLDHMDEAGINLTWAPVTGMLPNTMYCESNNPVLESPLSVVESLNYMLLQSSDDIIRVFPAIPSSWQDVSFRDLRTEGAFLVSGEYRNGDIELVEIESLAGQSCVVNLDLNDFTTDLKRELQLVESNNGQSYWKIPLEKNEKIKLSRKERSID